jgi:hypothetical protein
MQRERQQSRKLPPHERGQCYPSLHTNLIINGNTVFLSYKHGIHTALTTPNNLARIQQRNRGTPNNMDPIHWMFLGQVTKWMPIRLTQTVKLSHDFLPTAVLVHRYALKLPTYCMLYFIIITRTKTTSCNALITHPAPVASPSL